MSQAYVVQAQPRAVTNIAQIRAELSRAIRGFWASAAGEELRLELSKAAAGYGEDLALTAARLGLSQAYAEVAARHDLSRRFKMVWGKL